MQPSPVPIVPPRALTRAGEAPLIPGNAVALLCDGPEVYASWLADIAAARRFILFENYIFNNDRIGNRIADALIERAQAGVTVRLLYDWFGSINTSRYLWRRLAHGGVEVRAFNPPRFTAPLSAFQRDHRKSICIDGNVAHVSGLCVGDPWAGDPARGVPPWRDTGIRIAGPGAAAACRAFAETWAEAGPPLPPDLLPAISGVPAAGDAPVRVISGQPGRSRVYRIIQVLLALACRRIWLTDAYFLTPPALYESLLAAARDGVDVRVLVPGQSDVPFVNWLGRSGYAGLLSAGVRIFEWQGPMLHAKTFVIDGRLCRVGSSNLNLSGLLANWELDVTIEDETFGAAMEEMFLRDLGSATELTLRARRRRFQGRIERAGRALPDGTSATRGSDGQQGAARARGALGQRPRTGAAMARAGAAVLGVALRRQFEHSAWAVHAAVGGLLLGLGALGLLRPAWLGLGLSLLLLWFGIAALWQATAQWWRGPGHRRADRLRRRTGLLRRVRGYLQQAKGKAVSQRSPPPNQTEP